MKNNTICCVVFVFVLAVAFQSCEKYLEEMPQNKLKPSTTADYNELLNNGYINAQIMPYLDVLSDDVEMLPENQVTGGATLNMSNEMMGAYMWRNAHEESMPGNDIAFEKLYQSIFYANVVLDGISDALGVVLDGEIIQRTRDNIKGEAYALRAYSYFYLVNLYAKYYDPKSGDVDAGVPLTLTAGAEDKAYTRHSLKEVYELIAADLEKAVTLMEKNPIPKDEKLKFTAISAQALLARVYLYMHRWDEAIAHAKAVIAKNPTLFSLHPYGETLTSANNVATIFLDPVLPENGEDYLRKENANVLFLSGVNELVPSISCSYAFVSYMSANRDLADQFEPDDIRRYYFLQTFDFIGYAPLYPASRKLTCVKNRYMNLIESYMSIMTQMTGKYSRVIRTEEMYLIIAEACASKENSDLQNAVEYLNQLRVVKFRENKYIPLRAADFTPQSLLDFIALERRRELCFEGHRWFDLRRTTRPAMERVGYNNEVARLAKDDPRYVLQIPQRELDVNPSIGFNPR